MALGDVGLTADIGTAVSVIMSAGGIVLSMHFGRLKLERAARVVALEEAMRALLARLDEGMKLKRRIYWEAVRENPDINPRDIAGFAEGLIDQIEVMECGPFAVWANKEEKKQLAELRAYSEEWCRKFMEAEAQNWAAEKNEAEEDDDVRPYTIENFLDRIKSQIRQLSDTNRKSLHKIASN
jgi:hypothetical protein